ncbi:MAG: Asp23/Gls24 family envelope stress response protein [Oscillospiraceae bacterium]
MDNGVNLTAVSRSIMSEVRYNVSRYTGVEVKSVDVCVDSMVIG